MSQELSAQGWGSTLTETTWSEEELGCDSFSMQFEGVVEELQTQTVAVRRMGEQGSP